MTPITNADFCAELYRFAPSEFHAGIVCSFYGDPHADRRGKWTPRPYRDGRPWPNEVRDDWNNYACVSTFYRSRDGYRRLKAQFSRLCAVMVDDVGTKIDREKLRLLPSAIVETSPGNFQYWYFLTPSADSDDLETATRLVDRLVASELTKDGVDPGMKGVTRVGRLPVGVNAKPALGEPWQVRLVEWNPERRYALERIAEAYGLDMTPPPKPAREHTDESTAAAAKDFGELLEAIEAHGLVIGEAADGYDVVCPWVDDHSTRATSGTKLFTPSDENAWLGGFKCHHGHCTERTIGDVLDWATRRGAADFEPTSEAQVDEAKPEAPTKAARLRGPDAARVTPDELEGTPYEPPAIVDGYLPQDAGGTVAPGGTGKTTLILFESVHIALGRPLYGRRVLRPGTVLILTAEDSREVTLSRLNKICRALSLSAEELELVRSRIFVEDVSDSLARLALADRDGNVRPTDLVDDLVKQYSGAGLAMLVLDPTSLLGPGETSGNDGMAGLMRVSRAISRRLKAAVRLVHHVSQAVARGGIADQYAGRGGTAFADNSRFQHQIVRVAERRIDHDGTQYTVPDSIADRDLADGNVLAIHVHKISYQWRNPTPILIVRNGFAFRHVELERVEKTIAAREAQATRDVEQVCGFLERKLAAGLRLTKREIEDAYLPDVNLKRTDFRRALAEGLASGRIVEADLPPGTRQGSRLKFLQPITTQADIAGGAA